MKKRLKQAVILLMVVILVGTICPVTALAAPERVPAKVSGIKVSASKSSEDSVKIRWKKAKNATSYRICYRPFNSKKWKTLKTVNGKTTGYIHKNSKKNPLKVGRRYYYTVKAYNKYSGKWGKYDTRGASIKLSSEWKKGQSWDITITGRGEIGDGGTWESFTW